MEKNQTQKEQGFIYVGEYFHKFGKEVPTEKKIGKTTSMESIPQIDDHAFSLDFIASDVYLVDKVDSMYEALVSLINHNQLKDDWFDDADGDLKERIAKFMKAFGYIEVSDVDGDGIPDHLDDTIG